MHSRRAMVREPMARKIQGDEVQLWEEGRQAIEGVGVIEPAVEAQKGDSVRVAPGLGGQAKAGHIDGKRFAEAERRGGTGTLRHGGCP